MAALPQYVHNDIDRRRRDYIRAILQEWGAWEAEGRYQEKAQRSIMARLIEEGPVPPCSEPGPKTLFVGIPRDVAKMGRVLNEVATTQRNGPRLYRAIYLRHASLFGPSDRTARLGHEDDDGLRAQQMKVSVAAYRTLVTRGLDSVCNLWWMGVDNN